MSHHVLENVCIGCGGCEFACPTGALTKTDSFLGLFTIDPFTCNDCGECIPKCPVNAIETDPSWPVCGARGCPLQSTRLAGFECAYWQQRCPECGTTLWREPESGLWSCPTCDQHRRVRCPRTNQLFVALKTAG